jgi:hypothetical protein
MYSDVNADDSKGSFDGSHFWKMNSVRAYGQLKF